MAHFSTLNFATFSAHTSVRVVCRKCYTRTPYRSVYMLLGCIFKVTCLYSHAFHGDMSQKHIDAMIYCCRLKLKCNTFYAHGCKSTGSLAGKLMGLTLELARADKIRVIWFHKFEIFRFWMFLEIDNTLRHFRIWNMDVPWCILSCIYTVLNCISKSKSKNQN